MKKLIRVLFPLFLVISILFCVIWYLFAYDREFTRDMLLTGARYFETQGNRNIAATFYNLAYKHSDDNDAVAIELAEQYKSSGNYTKAEYTLSNAIAEGGNIELYIALCKTYIEQDKLLDAVAMLNSVTDPKIKEALSDLRPTAPTVSAEPGYYSQYINVDVQSDSSILYVTTDGTYPSTFDTPYSEPITLVLGENTIIALAVADNGLVSPLSTFGYIVGGVIEEVSFEDPAISAKLHEMLDIKTEDPIYTNQLWDILEFTMPQEAQNYSDLRFLTYLDCLNIDNGISSELDKLSSLSHLSTLTISNCTVSEESLQKIAQLPMLNSLSLQNCGISSISALSSAVNLISLNLNGNAVRNLTPLSNLQKLQELYLQHNAVSDLSPLSSLNSLQKLDISYNALTTLSPITTNSSLTWLNAGTNSIVDVGEINRLTALTYLSLEKNSITDISKVSNCLGITELNISNNSVSDISALYTLNKLMYFNFSYNQISKLPQWSKDCALVTIDGTSNQLSSIASLGGLPSLNNVYMDYNTEITSVAELADCPRLIQVNVYGTKVTDVLMLTNQSVIVNYNPVQELPA